MGWVNLFCFGKVVETHDPPAPRRTYCNCFLMNKVWLMNEDESAKIAKVYNAIQVQGTYTHMYYNLYIYMNIENMLDDVPVFLNVFLFQKFATTKWLTPETLRISESPKAKPTFVLPALSARPGVFQHKNCDAFLV